MKSWLAVAGLFVMWLLSMYFYLPLSVIVVLFAVLVSMATLTISSAWVRYRRGRAGSVIKRDAKV